jgi:hypothetical protein
LLRIGKANYPMTRQRMISGMPKQRLPHCQSPDRPTEDLRPGSYKSREIAARRRKRGTVIQAAGRLRSCAARGQPWLPPDLVEPSAEKPAPAVSRVNRLGRAADGTAHGHLHRPASPPVTA